MTEKLALNGPSVMPANGEKAKKIMLFLHGYGANGNDLIDLAHEFKTLLPDTVFYSPDAPEPFEGGDFFGGRQWYSLVDYDPTLIRRDAQKFEQVMGNMLKGAKTALPVLELFINQLLAKHELTEKDLIISGFSQGGLMTLCSGLTRKTAPLAVISFSGVPVQADFAKEITCKPPVMLCHGDMDDIVPPRSIDVSKNTLENAKINVKTHVSLGVGHGIDKTALNSVKEFLQNIL